MAGPADEFLTGGRRGFLESGFLDLRINECIDSGFAGGGHFEGPVFSRVFAGGMGRGALECGRPRSEGED